MFVSAWEYKDTEWVLHKEELKYDVVKPTQRSYK
jgi:succinate dehydrogenase / fumarate reductase flavoprotein subunit